MRGMGAKNVLIKGGHLTNAEFGNTNNKQPKTDNLKKAIDFLFLGGDLKTFEAEFIETDATHGTGCTLAAAIAANLANGKSLVEAVAAAKNFVTEAIRTAPNIGKGHSPINHTTLRQNPGF